ncbi:MAG: hypothetical protein C3F02_00590 [Parcubacteria group bacterium]|nr:MAG: hypothetical protein C3F02_00590 [Parcubacteria group bacterium]
MKKFLARWQKMDWLLFFAVVILLVFSCSILYSLNLNIGSSDFLVFKKQLFFAVTGLVLYFAVAGINYNVWSTYSKLIFIVSCLVLASVLIIGTTFRGTTGWLTVAGFNIQPVEFAKLALIIWLAKFFSDHAREFQLFRYLFMSAFFSFIFIFLVLLQPDLGSAMVMFGTWVILILFTGVKRKYLWWMLTVFCLVAVLSWFFLLAPYQKARITTFFNPGSDPKHSGYNVIQSMVAVGSGQVLGRGLALGSQSSLRFLPEPGTDFIYAVIAEDLGFLGSAIFLLLFVFIFYRLFLIIRKSQDDFGSYLVLGLTSMLLVQLFINVGMNMGISPVTGIPLPLVSAGGSSLWAVLMGLGMAQSVQIRNS